VVDDQQILILVAQSLLKILRASFRDRLLSMT